MKKLVYIKLGVFLVSAITLCARTMTKAGGIGGVATQRGTSTGSKKIWMLVRFTLVGAASCATFASNAADFQRYATKSKDVIRGNLLRFPFANASPSPSTERP